MEIELRRNYGFELIYKDTNIHVVDDIEERVYYKKEDGKIDTTKAPERDINDSSLDMFTRIMEDLIYYREKKYDTSSLIIRLFDKLPEESITALLDTLNKTYT